MTDEPAAPVPDEGDYEAEPRRRGRSGPEAAARVSTEGPARDEIGLGIAWRESATRRLSRQVEEDEQDRPAEPFRSPGAFGAWVLAAVRALFDIQFRRPATRTLLPLAYILGLAFAFAVPIVSIALLWQVSMLLGLVFAVVVAVPLGLTIAASVRLALEFLVNASRLANRVEHINALADDLFQALSDVAEPVNQLSEDVRAVQFWRFRKRSTRK
ncbi:DUF4282 domain-containing protein [Nocardia transvalensis]|uniref:DUF4282 domain-containing protein n=1 Tax=Nocardia transvalensis TaxID=37333 RepID=UPI001893DD98|nr:DUF4282 domain-containing protein [Nocardia transvalensis]MBF6328564.1 DUF4282 domain-containing protein [Nocardia transvalensis]